MGRNVQVGMLSKLGVNQVSTRRYVKVVNTCATCLLRCKIVKLVQFIFNVSDIMGK